MRGRQAPILGLEVEMWIQESRPATLPAVRVDRMTGYGPSQSMLFKSWVGLETLLGLGHQGKREGVPLYPP
jgi:hypothetical protein